MEQGHRLHPFGHHIFGQLLRMGSFTAESWLTSLQVPALYTSLLRRCIVILALANSIAMVRIMVTWHTNALMLMAQVLPIALIPKLADGTALDM